MEDYNFIKTDIDGICIVEPKSTEGTKEFYMEYYTKQEVEKKIRTLNFIHDTNLKGNKGVVRGLHFQKVKPQARLIRVKSGNIYNVYVDIRKNSKTFGQWRGVYLSSENKKLLYIPQGFANGFLALCDYTEVIYSCDEIYYPQYRDGFIWNDDILKINWNVTDPILDDEDKKLPTFRDYITKNI